MSPPLSPLELLPNELLDQIISYISTEAPSFDRLHQSPSLKLQSRTRNLKHLAQVSTRLLRLVRPQLFAHALLDLHEENKFHSFIINSDLCRYVTSLVVIGDDSPDHRSDPFWWRRVLQYLDPVRITVLAPPKFIGRTLGTPIMDGHSWAFDIDLQLLQLERDEDGHGPPAFSDLESHSSLLSTRPWRSLSFNESSSLRAYNHYEYFLFQVPSILGEWGSLVFAESLPEHLPITQPLRNLTAVSYTAIFPFYNHVRLVLDVLATMPSLRCLSLQLAPDENNNIIETEQRSSMDPSDPWMELETSYSLICFSVNSSMEALKELRTRDYHLESMRTELAASFDTLGGFGWTHDGHGTWRRA